MNEQFHLDAETAATVVVATASMYAAFVILVGLAGRARLVSRSTVGTGCVIATGAVIGRTSLLTDPTIANGLVALTTFFVLDRLFSVARRLRPLDCLLQDSPVAIVRDGQVLDGPMARSHVTQDDLRQALRLAGHHGLDRVALVVVERNGALSVLDDSAEVDGWMQEDLATGGASTAR